MRYAPLAAAALALTCCAPGDDTVPNEDIDLFTTDRAAPVTTEDRFAILALDCVDREYPNKISHVLNSDDDARAPRELFPAFYGCFDWHSSVHGHWLLTRILTTPPKGAARLNGPMALRGIFSWSPNSKRARIRN